MASQKKIKDSLYAQLKAKGADVAHFEALVDDYMSYFKMVQAMKKDIKDKGMSYMTTSAAGKKYEKDNPNMKLLPQYTRSMLAILKELGLTTDNITEDDGEL
jgi:phage terminase small subunit